MPRTGQLSTFSVTGSIQDTFNEKSSADIISSDDWNKLGDAIYRVQHEILEIKTNNVGNKFNKDVKFWSSKFTPTWNTVIAGQLSCTGSIILPISCCTELGTYWPVQNCALVKVQATLNTPDNLRYFEGANITTAVYCPSNTTIQLNNLPVAVPPVTNFDPLNPPTLYRQIIVGLYFDGYPVPTNINSLGIKCHVFISYPG